MQPLVPNKTVAPTQELKIKLKLRFRLPVADANNSTRVVFVLTIGIT